VRCRLALPKTLRARKNNLLSQVRELQKFVITSQPDLFTNSGFCLAPMPRMQARVSRALSRRDSRTQPRVSTLGTRRIIPNRPARGGRFEIAGDKNINPFNPRLETNPLLRPFGAHRLMAHASQG
jgi:hypothetical protein